jgi:hypothetical protein
MIEVVVVESHNHALEHIHTALRQRRLLNQDWSMLHFDAHADLACPGHHIPAISCYRPHMTIRTDQSSHHCDSNGNTNNNFSKESDLTEDDDKNATNGKNLYELLDATASGIAEWILPLVLAANLRSICWIRPPRTIPLIPSGVHQYHVGVHVQPENASNTLATNSKNLGSFLDLPLTALVKVDWDCRYYLEDDSYVPSADLLYTQPLNLNVRDYLEESNVSNTTDCRKESVVNSKLNNIHAVDVCLDYFSCYNPFLKDIESRSSTFAKALYEAFIQSRLYSYNFDTQTTSRTFSVEVLTFRQQFAKVLRSLPTSQLQEDQLAALIPFYDNAQIVIELFHKLQSAFDGPVEEYKKIIELSVEALPHLTMPHTTLDLCEFNDSLIQQQLIHMRSEILGYSRSASGSIDTPFIVTVARSTEDGFTPRHDVDHLQDKVLNEIHTVYCGCSRRIQTYPSLLSCKLGNDAPLNGVQACKLRVVFDFGS